MAFLAFTEGYTFSDKIAPTDWPSLCRGILDSQADTVWRNKMMLGAQNNISGLSQHSYFSFCCGFASKKEGDQLSRKQLLRPLKLEMQRANAKTQDDYANYMAESIQLPARRYLDEP